MFRIALITDNKMSQKIEEFRILADKADLFKYYSSINSFLDGGYKVGYNVVIIDNDCNFTIDGCILKKLKKVFLKHEIYGYTHRRIKHCDKMISSGYDEFYLFPNEANYMMVKISKLIDYRKGGHNCYFCCETEIVVDTIKHTASIKDEYIELSNQLYEVLICLLSNKGYLVTYDDLYCQMNQELFSDHDSLELNKYDKKNIHNQIYKLKQILNNDCIKSVKNTGYIWRK